MPPGAQGLEHQIRTRRAVSSIPPGARQNTHATFCHFSSRFVITDHRRPRDSLSGGGGGGIFPFVLSLDLHYHNLYITTSYSIMVLYILLCSIHPTYVTPLIFNGKKFTEKAKIITLHN